MYKNKVLDILVIDDEPANIQTVESLLESKYNILVANSAKVALDVMAKRENPPHIILLDICMPDMDGFELIKIILEDKRNKDIQILILSANDSIEYLEEGLNLGASDYLTKPIEPKKFLLKIDFWSNFVKKTLENKQNVQLLEQYKNVVDRSTIVSKTNKSGIITYVNEKFCELSEYTKEELIGKSHNIVRHGDMKSEIFQNLWETISTGKPWQGIVKNKKKNGDFYIVDTIINPIIDNNGNILEYIGIRHDITEVETYKELLKNELSSTNKSLKENINYMTQYEDAINSITAILKTDVNNFITYANEKFCELVGYSLEEILGKNCSFLRDESHRLANDCKTIREELNNKKTVSKLLINITKNGDKIYLLTLFYPILDLDGNIIEHLQVMHDVTDIFKLNDEIEDTQKEVVLTMGAIGETRSKETGLHVKRVAEYSYLLAKLAGMSEKQANLLKQASPMHDIGKVGIPDNVLNKPGKLTNEEFEIIKSHSSLGYEMLKHSQRDILKTAATVAYTHHEKYDGTGYPNSLVAEDIPIEGRITAIVDVFDALGHDRCYKKAWEMDKIIELFEREKGTHFDPKLIDLFFENLDLFLEIRDSLDDKV